MKFRIVNNAWWMFWARGMVLWPWLWLRPVKTYPEYDREQFADWYQGLADKLYRHELQHCYQIKRMGRVKFYATYCWFWLKGGAWWGGYRNHPYEIEANEHEDEPLTELEYHWREMGEVEL